LDRPEDQPHAIAQGRAPKSSAYRGRPAARGNAPRGAGRLWSKAPLPSPDSHETQATITLYTSGVLIVVFRAKPLTRDCATRRGPVCFVAASIRRAKTGFLLRVRPANATLISRIAICLWHFRTLTRDQKLFPHFSEAGAAIFAIEHFEYGGHRHPHR
jgi:hypothetical protein